MALREPAVRELHGGGGRLPHVPTCRLPLLVAVPILVAVLAACSGDDGLNLSPTASEGRRIANASGCAGCHGADGNGGVGPDLAGLAGSQVQLADGRRVVADDSYLARAIADPAAEVVRGFNIDMPANDLDDEEIAKVIAYIKELK